MICAGHDSSCVVDACDKRPYLFGCAKGGVLGPSVDENIYWPEPSAFLKDNEISYVDIGGQIAIAKTADGRLLAWGAALSKLYNLKSRYCSDRCSLQRRTTLKVRKKGKI